MQPLGSELHAPRGKAYYSVKFMNHAGVGPLGGGWVLWPTVHLMYAQAPASSSSQVAITIVWVQLDRSIRIFSPNFVPVEFLVDS